MSYFGEPPRLLEPLKFIKRRIGTNGKFLKLVEDGNGSDIVIGIDVNKKIGTIAKCYDKNWEEVDKSSEIDLEKLEGAEKLFNEAKRMYTIVTMRIQ